MNRPASLLFYPSPSLFLSLSLSLFLVLSVCVCEPRKVGKESEGGSKKRKEVGNDNSLTSMFAKQQTACDLNKAPLAYNSKRKRNGVRRSSAGRACAPVKIGSPRAHQLQIFDWKETVTKAGGKWCDTNIPNAPDAHQRIMYICTHRKTQTPTFPMRLEHLLLTVTLMKGRM